MPNDTFVDWVYLAQKRSALPGQEPWPEVNNGYILHADTFQMGEIDGTNLVFFEQPNEFRYGIKAKHSRGSFNTNLLVRCDGGEMTISGNPGRFDRPDNVFNYSIEETVEIANQRVQEYGLPHFQPGEVIEYQSQNKRDHDRGVPMIGWTGAFFREIHVTRNLELGSPAMRDQFLRWASNQSMARVKKGVHGTETVQWGRLATRKSPLHFCLIAYSKAQEMLDHAKGKDAKDLIKKTPIYQYCQDTGLCRIEAKMGRHFLRDNGLRYLGDVTMEKLIYIFNKKTAFLLDAEPDKAVRLVSDMPTPVKVAALHWIRGEDLRIIYPRSTFFKLVKKLKDFGIDASEKRSDIQSDAESALQNMLDSVPHFDIRPATPPDWYNLPPVEMLPRAA